MKKPRILIVQARDPDDPMANHELECMKRRIGAGAAEVEVRNAIDEDASSSWLDGVDGLILGGSGSYSVHHPQSQKWVTPLRRLLERALDDDVPGFGICFGHQLLGYHLGAPVHTDETFAEVGTVEVALTEAGQKDPLFDGLEPTFPAHTGHSDYVTAIPEDVELLATNPTLDTQAFRMRGTRFYTTQFHPDLTGAEAVARYRAFADGDQSLLTNVARFRPGSDAAVALLVNFVSLVSK